MIRPLLRFLFASTFSLLFVTSASAAVVTWDGGGGVDTNWNTCANWSPSDVCPTSADVATFNATSTNNVTINTSINVLGVNIATGYTGIITQSSGVTITVGTSDWIQATGTFVGGDSAIDFNRSFNLSGGSFTSTSGTLTLAGDWNHTNSGTSTFAHNNGTVEFDSTAMNNSFNVDTASAGDDDFYNVTINKTNTTSLVIGSTDAIIVNNDLTLTDGRLATGIVQVKRNITMGASYDTVGNSAPITFNGTGTQVLNFASPAAFDSTFTVNKSSGTFRLDTNLTLDDGSSDFTLTLGTVDLNGMTLRVDDDLNMNGGTFTSGTGSVDAGDFIFSAGTFNAPSSGTFTVDGDYIYTSSATFVHNNGTVEFTNSRTNNQITVDAGANGTAVFYNVRLNKTNAIAYTISTGDTVRVTNLVTIDEGRFVGGTLEIQGSLTVSDAADAGGTSAMLFSGTTATQNVNLSTSSGDLDGNFTINKASGSVVLLSDIALNAGGQDMVIQSGTLNANGFSIDVEDDWNQTGGTFTGGAGTLEIGDLIFSGGTLTAPSSTLRIDGDWTHTNASTTATFAHNGGTVTFFGSRTNNILNIDSASAGTETFYNVTIDKTNAIIYSFSTGDKAIVTNNLTFTEGRVTGGSFEVQGHVTGSATMDAGVTTTLLLYGGNTQNFTLGVPAGLDGDITVNKSGGSVQLGSTLTMDTSGQDLMIQEGTFDLNGNTLSVTGAGTEKIVIETGGNLQLQGGETITGDSASYPQLDSGSTVTYDGTVGPYTLKKYTYHHLTFNGSGGVFQPSVNVTLAGNLTITAGTFYLNGKNLTVSGSFNNDDTIRLQGTEYLTLSAGNDSNSGTVEYVGDGDGAADTYGMQNLTFYNLKVNFTDANDTLDFRPYTANTLISNLLAYWKLDETTIGGAGSIVDANGSYAGTPNSFASPEGPSTDIPSTVQFTDPRSWDFDGSADNITTTLNLDQDSASSSAITFAAWVKPESTSAGDHYVMSTDNAGFDWGVLRNGSTWYVFNGTGSQSTGKTVTAGVWQHIAAVWKPGVGVEFYLNGVSFTNGTISYDNSDNNVAIGTNPGFGGYFDGLIDDVRIYNRALSSTEIGYLKDGYNSNSVADTPLSSLTVNGSVTILGGIFEPPSSVSVAGSWTDTGSGTLTEGSGTVTFTGAGTINSNEAFENVTINSSGTVTLGATLDVDANLTITAGTLDVSGTNYGITVGGNWAKSGTFTQRSGTVTFDTAGTTSTISGNTTFNNLTSATAGKPLTFTAGSTQTVSGAFTLTGAVGNLIVLRSSIDGTAWNLNVAGTSSVAYADVKDSNASGGNSIQPTNSTNSLGNTNWIFNRAPTVSSITASQASNGTANVNISFVTTDLDGDNTLQAKVEYSLDGGSTWNDPTLSTAGADTAATQGDPSVDNAVTYQVGQSGAFILSSGGANTVTTVWVGATDLLTTINIANARIRVTPYDGTAEGTAASSSNFILDRVAPVGLANFGYSDFSSGEAVLTWTATSDTNFHHYEIWHGETESQVIARSGSAVEWDNDNDATLTTASTATTTINNTDPRNKFFKIFAVDNYGNELTVSTVYISGGQSSSSSSSSGSSGGGGGGGGSSSGSSSSSSSDEDEAESEETAGSSSGEDSDTESDGGSGSEQEDEPVVEVDEETSADTTWEEMGIEPPDHWSQGYVKYLQEQNNIIQVAVTEPTFMDILLGVFTTPDALLDRARALEFLIVIAGYDIQVVDLNTRTMAFTDVPADHDRAAFIQFGFEQGLINGYPDGTFQPEMTINRVEALKMATFFFEGDWTHPVYGDELLDLYDLEKNPFTDVDLNAWYAPYLINAYAKGVVHGYGDGTFGPGNYVTYAEFLKIATLMKNVEEAVELAEELQ